MICEICEKNPAKTIGLIEGENKYLCNSCYKKFVNSDDFADLINSVQKDTSIHKYCTNCGASLDDIKKTNLFGCPKCYEVFYDILNKSDIQNLSNKPKLFEVKEKIANYNELIEKALARQDYLTVNNLSAKIDALRGKYDAKL